VAASSAASVVGSGSRLAGGGSIRSRDRCSTPFRRLFRGDGGFTAYLAHRSFKTRPRLPARRFRSSGPLSCQKGGAGCGGPRTTNPRAPQALGTPAGLHLGAPGKRISGGGRHVKWIIWWARFEPTDGGSASKDLCDLTRGRLRWDQTASTRDGRSSGALVIGLTLGRVGRRVGFLGLDDRALGTERFMREIARASLWAAKA